MKGVIGLRFEMGLESRVTGTTIGKKEEGCWEKANHGGNRLKDKQSLEKWDARR